MASTVAGSLLRDPDLKAAPARNPWLAIEVRHLAALAEIARTGSFSAAADRLGYVQSAVSQQLSQLERRVGCRLVERSRGSREIRLTTAGEVLVGHAGALLKRLGSARREFDAAPDTPAGSLRVGVIRDAEESLLPRILPPLASRWPQVHVTVTSSPTDVPLFELLERGEIELALCELPAVDGPFLVRPLLRDPFVLLVCADSKLARSEERPTAAKLGQIPLIGYRQSRAQDRVRTVMRARGVELRYGFASNFNTVIHGFVAAGLCAALVPRLTVSPPPAGTVAIELPELPNRILGFAWRHDLSPSLALGAFAELARSTCTPEPNAR